MKRKYLNINSTHKFIPGNRKIAEILDVNKTSLTSDKSILLAQVNINTTGDYSYAGTPEGMIRLYRNRQLLQRWILR